MSIQLFDEATLQVEGDVGDVEKQQRMLVDELRDRSLLQRIVVCCSVLQRVAVCCSVLQCVAVCREGEFEKVAVDADL